MKVQAHSYLELPQEYNQEQTFSMSQGSLLHFKPSWELWKYYAVSD